MPDTLDSVTAMIWAPGGTLGSENSWLSASVKLGLARLGAWYGNTATEDVLPCRTTLLRTITCPLALGVGVAVGDGVGVAVGLGVGVDDGPPLNHE